MKTLSLTLVLSLVAIGTAGAIALPAASETVATEGGLDPKAVADCVAYFVEQTVTGRPIEPCAVGATFETGNSDFVDCVKSQVSQILSGVTPMPCTFPADNAGQLDPKKVVECTRYVVDQIVTGRPVLPCDVSFEAATAGPDVDAIVECTKKAVRDIVQGTPQPCPI